MKPYSIIQTQPQLCTITRVVYQEPIKQEITIQKFIKPNPNKISYLYPPHVIPKHYQQRKKQQKCMNRICKSFQKNSRTPIFQHQPSRGLSKSMKKTFLKSQNQQNNTNNKILQLPQKANQKLEQTSNIQNKDNPSIISQKQPQKAKVKQQPQQINKQINKTSQQKQINERHQHRPIFETRQQFNKLIQSKLSKNNSPTYNRNKFIKQSLKQSRRNTWQSSHHTPIFSKSNHKNIQSPNNQNKLTLCSHFGQINFKGCQQQQCQKTQANKSQLQTTVKKYPIYKTIQLDLQPKTKIIYHQPINRRIQPYTQSKFYPIATSFLSAYRTSQNYMKPIQNTPVYVKFTYHPRSLQNDNGNLKFDSQQKQNNQKFKEVVGLKQSAVKNSNNIEQKDIKASQQNYFPTNYLQQQPKQPKIILDRRNKQKKQKPENHEQRSQKDDLIPHKLRTQSSYGSQISVNVIKISNLQAIQI